MKRYLIFTLLFILSAQVFGQTHTPCRDCDTIKQMRHRNYYYNQWYDTCSCYRSEYGCYFVMSPRVVGNVAKRYTTKEPLKIKGLTALTMVSPMNVGEYMDTLRDPEYLYLYQKVCPDNFASIVADSCMVLIDSVRWDTVKPHYMMLKPYYDSDIYKYCYAYDVYFDKPVIVDSVFYIRGTRNSVYRSEINNLFFQHISVDYASFQSYGYCDPNDYLMVRQTTYRGDIWGDMQHVNVYGHNLPIIDNDSLSVLSCDTLRGSVAGSDHGYIPHGHTATIQATANPGYRFAYWSDGTTSNPKSFIIDRDTTFIAYFFHNQLENCTITVSSSNPAMGSASGGGQYLEGDTATLTATPTDSRYTFDSWSDGNTDNPRHFTVSGPVTLTAFFTASAGTALPDKNVAVEVYPNPTTGFITLSQYAEKVEVLDNVGRLVAVAEGVINMDLSDLTDGTYTLRISTNDCVVIKKIVKR